MADIRTDEQRLKDIEETANHPIVMKYLQPPLLNDIRWLCKNLRHVQAENERLMQSPDVLQTVEINRLREENARLREALLELRKDTPYKRYHRIIDKALATEGEGKG